MLARGDDEIGRRGRAGWRDVVRQMAPVVKVVPCKRLVPAARDRTPDVRPYEWNPGVGLRGGSVQTFHGRVQPDLDEDTSGRPRFLVVRDKVERTFFRRTKQRRELPCLMRTVVFQLDGHILTFNARNPEINERIAVLPFPAGLRIACTKIRVQRLLRTYLRSTSCHMFEQRPARPRGQSGFFPGRSDRLMGKNPILKKIAEIVI